MLHDKKFISLLFLLILSLGFSACTQSTSQPEPSHINAECNVDSLIAAINSANASPGIPTEIHLPANCEYPLTEVDNNFTWLGKSIYNGLPRITSEIIIRGNNSVIDIQPGSGQHRFGHFFLDPEKKLSLYDLTLSSGARPRGGSIINDQGDLFLYNVQLLNNLAYSEGSDAPAAGGAIFNSAGKVRIIAGSLFQGNMAGETLQVPPNRGGAVYSFNGSLQIYSSNFLDNYAVGEGGAIYTAKNTSNPRGGLILVNDSSFSGNQALKDGGAMYIKSEEGVYIATSVFDQNTADGLGGALFSEDSDLNIPSSQLYGNEAEYGGAVFTRRSAAGNISNLSTNTSYYTYNTAAMNGGGIFSENSDVEIENTLIRHNTAFNCGGLQLGGYPGMDVLAGDLETTPRIPSSSKITYHSSVSHNKTLGGFGGGVCHLMGELTVRDSNFNNNLSPFYGGGMISMDELDVTGSTFRQNEAWLGGGLAVGFPLDGINYVSPTYLDFHSSIAESMISENTANYQGGGIWAHHGGYLWIQKSTIGGNQAGGEGGGVYQGEGDLYIDNSTIAENTATRGGGLYNHDGISTNPVLRLMHTTVAYNTATDTGDELRSGGGGLNINGTVYVREILVAENTNKDCDLNQGLHGDFDQLDCGDTYCMPLHNVDSDETCAFYHKTNLHLDSFNGTYVPILPGSSIIDWSPCQLQDDQIGTARPQGADCEPGSNEYQPITPPPPPPSPPQELAPPEEVSDCDPFAGLEITTMLLSINPETLALPVYLRFQEAVPGVEEGTMPYWAVLGGTESYLCNQQGFPDRLYCMFRLPSTAPGSILDLEFYQEGCQDPIFTQPKLTIPEVAQTEDENGDQPTLTCRKDLNEKDCITAGGLWPDIDKPYCVCPQ